ncbi:UNKNOWN [Stylonychia lemnae]|uniref:Uncharacterized protein n=1 Tax=Stylonychia lemnae TaxID=5949 RepID=A0A078B3P4_STYLE|nr:UNKNOWN [Stylonychia lemnae]|eukprot:CDW87842.1 UNKNOWN [Stylonychia lemnae]
MGIINSISLNELESDLQQTTGDIIDQTNTGKQNIMVKKDDIVQEIDSKLLSPTNRYKSNPLSQLKTINQPERNQPLVDQSQSKNQQNGKLIYDLKYDKIHDPSIFSTQNNNHTLRSQYEIKSDMLNKSSYRTIDPNTSVSLPPYALFNPKNGANGQQSSPFLAVGNHKILLNLSKERYTKRYYDKDSRLPYMDSNIDLSFPEIKSQVKLDQQIDSKTLQEGLISTRKAGQFIAEKNQLKIQNTLRNNEEFQNSYMNSSQVPHDIKRFTLVSKDNNVRPEEIALIKNSANIKSSRNRSINMAALMSNDNMNYRSAKRKVNGIYNNPFSDQINMNFIKNNEYEPFQDTSQLMNDSQMDYSDNRKTDKLEEAKKNFLKRKNEYYQKKNLNNTTTRVEKQQSEQKDKIVSLLNQVHGKILNHEKKFKATVNIRGQEKQTDSKIVI